MTRIVTTHYRHKRPPRKRREVRADDTPTPANDDRKPAIVTIRRGKHADVPGLTPEEHQRRGVPPMPCSRSSSG